MAEAQRPSWKMGGITNPAVEEYLYRLIPERDPVLSEMEQIASERRIPIVGPLVGRLLHQIAEMIGAKNVFEMGSAIGYSTIWWARALSDGGRVIYTDGDRNNADQARRFFERAGVPDRIDVRVGDAMEILSESKAEYDIIFNDVDKEDYPRVFRVAVPRLRKGGLLISDNTLWHGDVADPEFDNDERTRAIREFNRLMYESKDLLTTILPLRDGIAVARKQ
ncbi:MAG TPA: O-methyltransferase [Terriglobales bacterium]|nr:O-methyltransferase [Terriglobales bacterium]